MTIQEQHPLCVETLYREYLDCQNNHKRKCIAFLSGTQQEACVDYLRTHLCNEINLCDLETGILGFAVPGGYLEIAHLSYRCTYDTLCARGYNGILVADYVMQEHGKGDSCEPADSAQHQQQEKQENISLEELLGV